MPSQALLHEAQLIKDISVRLEDHAERHPDIGEALLTICGTLFSTATVLEVLVTTRMDPPN